MQGALKPEDLSRLRLVHDLKEVVSQPLPDVTALPVEHNIYEWHGNVRSSDGSFGGASVHFLLVFPQDYPRSPPECRLFTPVPHPNVSPATTAIPGAREARWRLALFDCVLNHSTWSCAYSVQSVLVQLQAFLLDEDLQFATSKVAPEEAVRQARAFTCPCQGCTHAPKKPSPAFLTPEQCAAASGGRAARVSQVASGASSSSAPAGLLAVEFVPAAKRPGAEALTMHQRPRGGAATAPAAAVGPKTPGGGAAASAAATPVKGSPAGSAASKSSAAASVASGSKAGSSKASGGGSSSVDSDEEEWVEVQGKKKKKQPSSIMPPSWTSHHHHHHHGKSTATSSAISNNSSTNAAATVAGAGAAAGAAAVAAGPSSSSAGAVWGNAFGALLTKEAKVLTKAMLKGKELSFESLPASGAGQQQQQQQGQQQQGVQQQLQGEPEKPGVAALGGAKAPLSKAAKKNAARAEKRKAKKGQVEEQQASPAAAAAAAGQPAAPSSAAATAAPATATATSKGPAVGVNGSAGTGPSVAAGEDGWTGVKGKGKGTPAEATDAGAAAAAGAVAAPPNLLQQVHELRNRSHHQLIKAVYREAADEAAAAAAAAVPSAAGSAVTMLTATPAATGSMGLLGCLPRDVMLEVLQLLKPSEVAVLAQASRGLTQACKDGQLWLALLQRHFPKSSLSHSQQSGDVSDLRHAFMLEAACVPDETRCFYSRAHYQSEVLGLPLRYTINPVTKVIDYIEVEPELMSVAVFAGGVDRTPAGERIDAVLPVYISAEHFARAQPALRKLLAKLGPSCTSSVLRNQPVGPETWLELIPAAMNTSAVLLSDKGVAASQRALNTYCMLHRLLLALCEQHGLWGAVSARLDHFLASPANRTKAACPNLGLIYPLLSLSPGHAWAQVAPALVSETFDRAVMWMCKSNLNLVDMFQNKKQQPGAGAGTSSGGTSGGYSDTDFLTAALNASVVSRRLLMFNVAFLRLVACPPGVRLESVMDSYDALLGRPGAGLLARFQRHVTRILAANSWTEFFALAGLRCPEPPALVAMLRRAWQEGVRKKYHSKDTNFAAIQSRGVSKILLKGETYSAPPGMRTITMEERWRWRPEDGTKFLDASCLLFDAQGNFLEAIDYSHRTSSCTSVRGAVRHSGDVLDDSESSGLHTITINLADLGDQVSHFYVTMSSWAGAKLNEIEQPFVSVTDPSTGMDLCAYHLGSEALEARRTHSSVIMCKVHRAPGVPGQWRVKAIGQLGQGQARSYGPMLEKIRALPA